MVADKLAGRVRRRISDGFGVEGERSRLGCTGRRPADRTVCSARAPNTAREARALPGLDTYRILRIARSDGLCHETGGWVYTDVGATTKFGDPGCRIDTVHNLLTTRGGEE